MSNTITIELCAEDRARLDRLADALERRSCSSCVATALQVVKDIAEEMNKTAAPQTDEVQKALAETLAKAEETVGAPKNAPEEAEVSTLSTTPQEEEKPTEEEPTPPPTENKVTRAELRAKVIELSAKGLKEQTREIIKDYAETVREIPEDKVAECFKRLVALESQNG